MNKIIQNALAPLVGLPLCHLGRSSNMLLLQFGYLHEVSARDGSIKTVHDWTIQIQCPWRISQNSQIVIGHRDFYYSDVGKNSEAVMNKSRSDTVLGSLCTEFEATPPRVISVDSDETGAFSLHLSDGYRLEAIPGENTESGKHWRIFEPSGTGRSFVFPPS
ncbi:MAG TPA: hypothetical protein VK811_05255, partial [Candidatus Acidoferrum sp.]|nr:hypothetical protein [Candidatus Acidoferrum sp.]